VEAPPGTNAGGLILYRLSGRESANENAPEFGGVSVSATGDWLGGLLVLDRLRRSGADLDLAGLGRFRHLMHQVDVQHAV
jgi:hypothetical protein